MTAQDWAGFTVALMTILAGAAGAIKWLVKHYLAELKPNGGGSMRDAVNINTERLDRVEQRVDQIYLLLCEKDQRTSSICFNLWNITVLYAKCTRN